MRRGGTLLVVVAVSAIALAAGWDALRGDGDPAAQPEERPTPSTEADEGTNFVPLDEPDPVSGTLYYTDEGCELRAAELARHPADRRAELGRVHSSRSRPTRRGSAKRRPAWDPHADPRRGRLFRTDGAAIQVATNAGPEGEPIRGTSPAWRPDGTLTYFADGEIRDWPEGRTVVSENRLRMVVTEHPNAPGRRLPEEPARGGAPLARPGQAGRPAPSRTSAQRRRRSTWFRSSTTASHSPRPTSSARSGTSGAAPSARTTPC